MPSFFSKKTRSQASAGPAGESPLGSAAHPPPPIPDDLLHQQQQPQFNAQFHQEDYPERRVDLVRRPSEPFVHGHHLQNHSPHSPYPTGVDLRYGRDLPLDDQQQQHQQQQQNLPYRHPAHHNASQPSIDRPTISLVTPQQQYPIEHSNYQPSPNIDKDSAEQLWTSIYAHANTSSQDLPDKPSKSHKKKGFFSRNQSIASSSPGKTLKKEKQLGRSASIKHTFRSGSPQPQQLTGRDLQSEHGRVSSGQLSQNQSISSEYNHHDSEAGRPPTGEPPSSPRVYEPSQPQTPSDAQTSQRFGLDPNDRSHRIWQHSRPASVESIPSQVSFQRQHMPSSSPYQGEVQPPSPLYFPSSQRDIIASHNPPSYPAPEAEASLGLWQKRSSKPEQLNFPARPSSRHSLGPASPLAPLPSTPYTQNSDLVISQASSRRPSVQQPSFNTSVSDMASTAAQQQQQAGARPSESQSQIPSRKDSLAAQSGQPYLQNTGQGGQSFKGNASQQNLQDMQAQGRETPPSAQQNSKLREELENLDVASLVLRHEELQAKYQKVKRYYFEKEAQVTQLQNTVAHQRMAVSRTVLDDNEYTARFNRLDGAIKELAFSIRKDWRTIPDWLHPYVNEDAVTVGTKEMTGVGRAVISRWIVEDLFNRYFHPGLERNFSERLKSVENNLRRQQVQVFNEDDKENQVARISNWRRTTLDGLTDELQSSTIQENMAQLAEYLVEKLSATLQCDLKEPAPPELAHYTRMIVENAINIVEKIPQESRDVVIDYIAPGTPISETTMKVETGLPPLTRSLAESKDSAANRASSERESNEEMDIDNKEATTSGNSPQQESNKSAHIPQNREQRKKYPFGSLMSKKALAPSSSSSNTATTQPQSQSPGGTSSSPSDNTPNNKEREEQQLQQQGDKRSRARFATFMTVEVRGRGPNNILIQAPVYTIES